jgi:hypothetical protein
LEVSVNARRFQGHVKLISFRKQNSISWDTILYHKEEESRCIRCLTPTSIATPLPSPRGIFNRSHACDWILESARPRSPVLGPGNYSGVPGNTVNGSLSIILLEMHMDVPNRSGLTYILLSDDRYTDLLFSCGKDEYRVHRAVICPQSAFFTAACNRGKSCTIVK